MTLEQRLNERINELETQLKNQTKELAKLEELEQYAFMQHEQYTEPAWLRHLPLPRLEIRFSDQTDKNVHGMSAQYVYGLVHRSFPLSFEKNQLLFIPFGKTNASGGYSELEHGTVPTPFRDGVHIKADAQVLGLPAYAICDTFRGQTYRLINELEAIINSDDQLALMRRPAKKRNSPTKKQPTHD